MSKLALHAQIAAGKALAASTINLKVNESDTVMVISAMPNELSFPLGSRRRRPLL